jgi:hypothetical protein
MKAYEIIVSKGQKTVDEQALFLQRATELRGREPLSKNGQPVLLIMVYQMSRDPIERLGAASLRLDNSSLLVAE